MKKTFKTMLALMAGAMVFTACNKDDIYENIDEQNPSELKSMTFTASMEGQEGATRATIDGLDIKWTTGDKISIFDGAEENNGNQEFTLATGEGTTSATFTGSAATASTYYALYPYADETSRTVTREEALAAGGVDECDLEYWKDRIESDENSVIEEMGWRGISDENQAIILAYLKNEPIVAPGAKLEGNIIKEAVLPAEQTVTDGQYVDPKAMLMIAQSNDANSLKFKNVCAYVKVTPQFDCKAIRLISKGAESLAGTVTLNYNDGTPTTNVTANGVSTVSLTGTITTGNTYYIAVLPETLNSGFTIRFVTTDAIYNKSTTKVLTLTRNNVVNLGSFATSDMIAIPKTGTAEATIGGVTVNVPWVQLWENGPKFAEYNVGATSATEYGGYYTWGGTYNNGQGIEWIHDQNTGTSKLSGDTDTATKLWGSNWRMPTNDELGEYEGDDWTMDPLCGGLLYECTCTKVSNYNGTGVNGLLCIGKGDYLYNSIFLPAAGFLEYSVGVITGYGVTEQCVYWTSIPGDDSYAYSMSFYEDNYATVNGDGCRWQGYSVRAVLAE